LVCQVALRRTNAAAALTSFQQIVAMPAACHAATMSDLAQKKLFSTFELLKKIILELPCLQIFALQRSSHAWKSVIKNSTILQTVLFLRPV